MKKTLIFNNFSFISFLQHKISSTFSCVCLYKNLYIEFSLYNECHHHMKSSKTLFCVCMCVFVPNKFLILQNFPFSMIMADSLMHYKEKYSYLCVYVAEAIKERVFIVRFSLESFQIFLFVITKEFFKNFCVFLLLQNQFFPPHQNILERFNALMHLISNLIIMGKLKRFQTPKLDFNIFLRYFFLLSNILS